MQIKLSDKQESKKPIILCVDDEGIILESLSQQLKKAFGNLYEIEAVDSGAVALQVVAESNEQNIDIPVIVCDQGMPVMRGDVFLSKVHETNSSTRKIMLTGLASAEAIGNAVNKANLYRYISKPWISADLILTVQEAIRSFYIDKTLEEKNIELEKSLFYNRDTNLRNWEKLQQKISESALLNENLTLAILKIENFAYFLEYFGAQIYRKILLELVKLIESKILFNGEEIFHTQQDELVILSANSSNEEFIHKLSIFRLVLKSEYISVEGLSFQISLFISITNGKKNLYSTAKSGLLYRFNSANHPSFSEHTNEIEFHKQNIFWGRKLNIAIEKKCILPAYQGIMDNATGKISKYECLVRMVDNDTIYTPDKFLSIASSMGILKLITIIVMDRAFSKFSGTSYEFSINLTQFDLEYKDFTQLVEAKLDYYNLKPQQVTFEILENISLNINSQSLQTLQHLKELGCKIAIDDFGVHYSNLARLLDIEPDFIKIDGWFIQNINKSRSAYLVTKAIIELSHSLKAKVIAEFVSEKSIQDKLIEMGVEYSQGFYIGKPNLEISG